MSSRSGEIDPKIGNAIRTHLVQWFSEYKIPYDTTFTDIEVRVNATYPGGYGHAIEASCEYYELRNKLQFHTKFIKFAETLKKDYGVILDECKIESHHVEISFLAPDGERIPPRGA